MALPPEVATLMKALDSLQTASTPTTLASLSRTVARAADDLELVCEETVDPSVSEQLNSYIERARQAVKTARKNARAAALKADRTALIEPPTIEQSESQSTAGTLAAEINDALRATAAVVSEEIQRSNVAGDVVEDSTRRLRMTTDQHGVYAEGIVSGASTLKSIRRTDLMANFVLVLCFALFFVAAAYVANRRLQSSNVATFIVRPTYKIASMPFRITSWVFKGTINILGSQSARSQYPSSTDPQDVKIMTHKALREPRISEDRDFSVGVGDHSLREKDTHNEEPREGKRDTPYVSPTQHFKDAIEKDIHKHSGNPPSLPRRNVIDQKIVEDSEPSAGIVDDENAVSAASTDLQKSDSNEQSEILLQPSPSHHCQALDDEMSATLPEHAVQETLSTESTSPRLSEDPNDTEGTDREPFVAAGGDIATDTPQSGGQKLASKKEIEALLYPLLSGEANPKPVEHMESTSKKIRDDEADKERSDAGSYGAEDDQERAQPELESPSVVQEYESLLLIPLPSQEKASLSDSVTDGNGTNEPVQSSKPQAAVKKDIEPSPPDNISDDTSETAKQNEPQAAKKGGKSSPSDNVTDGTSASETAGQTEQQPVMEKDNEFPPLENLTGETDASETVEQNEPPHAKEKDSSFSPSENLIGGTGPHETEEQNELNAAKKKDIEPLQSDSVTGSKGTSETVEQSEPHGLKDKEGEPPQLHGVIGGKGTSETLEQKEQLNTKDIDDITATKETPGVSTDAKRPKASEQHELWNSSGEKENEAPTEVQFSSLSEASESKETAIDMTATGEVGRISSERPGEEEHSEQLPFPASVDIESSKAGYVEGVSEERVECYLSSICLIPGIDDLLQISAISAWINV